MMTAPLVPLESKTEGPPGPGHRRSRSHRRRESLIERDDWTSDLREVARDAKTTGASDRSAALDAGRGVTGLAVSTPAKGPRAAGAACGKC